MTSKERVATAIRHEKVDRVPVMCQLSLGHYFINTNYPNSEIWFSAETFASALVDLQQKYCFDGILVNIHLRNADWKDYLVSSKEEQCYEYLEWNNGIKMKIPPDDFPQTFGPKDSALERPDLGSLDPDDPAIYRMPGYVWNIYHSPMLWTIDPEADLSDPSSYPASYTAAIEAVIQKAPGISVHSEVYSPFSHLMEMLGYENALMALLLDPDKCHSMLKIFTGHAIAQIKLQARCGIDAILVSSAFAGAGFISREFYKEFVMPYEDQCFREIRRLGLPSYVHTCGAIGDRLDLMAMTAMDGVDTLDPPPLGTVDLELAKSQYGKRFFFKGNLDSISDLLYADNETFERAVINRLMTGKQGSGYILSTACSVAPHVKPERLIQLAELSELYGKTT